MPQTVSGRAVIPSQHGSGAKQTPSGRYRVGTGGLCNATGRNFAPASTLIVGAVHGAGNGNRSSGLQLLNVSDATPLDGSLWCSARRSNPE
jgi:hypothetical protein